MKRSTVKTQRELLRLKWMALLVLSSLIVCAAPGESFGLDIYVSVDGSAQPDGSLGNPYGSLPDAVEAVRALRRAGNAVPVQIILREGRHQLDQTLVLGMEDGRPASAEPIALPQYGAGETAAPAWLTFAAYPGEDPVISAGVPVTGWKRLDPAPPALPEKARGKVWVADVPAGLRRFYTLYDAKGRLERARSEGFATTGRGDRRTLHFPKGALKDWDNLEDVEIQIRPSRAWVINMLPLASVDEASGVAKARVSATYEMGLLPGWVHNPSGANVWVENTLEALDEPGQWVVNTKTRKIYLWPSDPGPDGSPRGILAPSTSELIRVEGRIDCDGPADTPVRGISFEGLTFSHGDRWAWTSDETRLGWGMQHDWDMFDRPTAMLRFRGAEDCRATDCSFVNSGGSAVRLDLHAQRNRIADCEFAQLGEAGIVLAGYGPGSKDVNHHNEIVNNHIHHFSEITWHSPGIWAWQSGHNRIAHNELHHSGYSAVLITTRVTPDRALDSEGGRTVRHHEIAKEDKRGVTRTYEHWKRREKYNHSRHNLVEYNDISHAVQLLSDGNAIYVSGTGARNIVRYNYIHDNLQPSFPSAIRCDDDQHETLIYGNLLYHNHGFSAGIASKGINDIINNFIVASVTAPNWGYISLEWYPVTSSKVQRNIIVAHPDGGRPVAQRPRKRNRPGPGGPELVTTDMDSNLYWHPTDPHWVDEHLKAMRAAGLEKASRFGDPLFVDPAAGDFRFRPASPAPALGIEPLDVSKMGRITDQPLRVSDGTVFRPKASYPRFRWDHVPVYAHVGKASGDFTPQELDFLAKHFDFITIEKHQASHRYGSTEDGFIVAAREIKKRKPKAKVLFYWNASLDTSSKRGRYRAMKSFPADGFLKDRDGRTIKRRGAVPNYDLTRQDVRDWWSDEAARAVREYGADGVFADAMSQRREKGLGDEKLEALVAARLALLEETRRKVGPDKLIIYNGLMKDDPKKLLQFADGAMIESFCHPKYGSSKEVLTAYFEATRAAARSGKTVILKGWPGFTFRRPDMMKKPHAELLRLARERITFPLACFLVAAEPNCYFSYAWGYREFHGTFDWYPEFDEPLGPPKGAAERDGWTYRRQFEHATVFVDLDTKTARIDWKAKTGYRL